MLETPPLSLYVHIPWCIRKCPYCDFNSHEMSGGLPEEDYVTALCADFDEDLASIGTRQIRSVFFGGGTPSLFSAEAIGRLLDHVRATGTMSPDAEISLEANPGAVEAERFTGYRRAGVNRLSLGIQSFNDEHLKALGRVHDSVEARQAIDTARAAGFDNFNLDLMHGLPGQTPAQAIADLETALSFEPNHISWYELTIEPNTVFYRRPPVLPQEDSIIAEQETGRALLAQSGYDRYEVSAYARQGKASIHNINYWEFGDYVGIGAGAHGKLTFADEDRILRTRRIKQPGHYLANSISRCAERVEVATQNRPLEFLLNALRLRQGFTAGLFEARTGVPFSAVAKQVECLTSSGMLAWSHDRLAATEKGYEHLNGLLEEFL